MKSAIATVFLLLCLVVAFSSSAPITTCSQVDDTTTTCTVMLVEEVPNGTLVFDTAAHLSCGNCVSSSTSSLYNSHFKEDGSKRIFTRVHLDRESMVLRSTAPLPVFVNVSFVLITSTSSREVIVSIRIVDLNDNVPKFTSGGIALPKTMTKTVYEGPSLGRLIIALEAVDYDEGLNGTSLYVLEQSNPPFFALEVSNASGRASIAEICNTKELDRETTDTFTLKIIAFEGTDNPRNDTLILTIVIADVDDNPPVFAPTYYNVLLPQWTLLGTILITMTAHDDDIGEHASIEYSIHSVCMELNPPNGPCVAVPDTGWPFAIGAQSGDLQLTQFVTCILTEYRVTVNAMNPNNAQGGLATATVHIQIVARPDVTLFISPIPSSSSISPIVFINSVTEGTSSAVPLSTPQSSVLAPTTSHSMASPTIIPTTSYTISSSRSSPGRAMTDILNPSAVLGSLSHTTTPTLLVLPSSTTLTTADNSQWRTPTVSASISTGTTPPVVAKPCDIRTADYCFTAAAGITVLLFLSLFFNAVLLSTVISMKRKMATVPVTEKRRHKGTLPPTPSSTPTPSLLLTSSQFRSRSSINSIGYDAMNYGHVEFKNVIYESIGDQGLTETVV